MIVDLTDVFKIVGGLVCIPLVVSVVVPLTLMRLSGE